MTAPARVQPAAVPVGWLCWSAGHSPGNCFCTGGSGGDSLVAPDVEAGLSHLRCGRLGALFVLCQLIWSGMAIGCLAFAARLVGESVHTAVPDRFPVQLGNLIETIFATGAADRRPLPCENTGVLRCTVRVPFCLLWQLLAATACAFCCFGSVPLWAGPGCCAW